jgi:transcriptional regulator
VKEQPFMALYANPKHKLDHADARAALAAFDRAATLVVPHGEGMAATHLPLLLRGDRLIGHVARANPVWQAAPSPALVICAGVETYVSPGWYPSKVEHGRAVPTWNYETIHVHGRMTTFEEPTALADIVSALSDRHEDGRAQPWRLTDAPHDYVAHLLRMIVGVEIAIERIEAKRKLSQDKPAYDRDGVLQGLSQSSDPRDQAVAEAMRATGT